MNRRKGEAVDPVAVGQGDGFEVHHLQKALSPGKPYGQVSQQPLGLLQDPIKAGEVGEGGEVGLEGGLGGQVAFGEVLALEEEEDGEGQELVQSSLLVLLLFGELEALSLKGLELVIHPDVDGHEKGFCVKIVEGVLTILPHGTPSFFTSRGSKSSSTGRHVSVRAQGVHIPGAGYPATCRGKLPASG
jgi:hypothetical protein